ncbi:MAG: Ig-like domain-containing protein, partial [Armatimonadetes bacterium]|nr:Ig-like domain-containing protein [Armatimonadota bacterium]
MSKKSPMLVVKKTDYFVQTKTKFNEMFGNFLSLAPHLTKLSCGVVKKTKKRILPIVLIVTTLVWSFGIPLGILMPAPARAEVAVTVQNWADMPMTVSSGMMMPVFALKITGSAGETLKAIKIRTVDIASSGFNPSSELAHFNDTSVSPPNDNQGFCIYKDTNENGWFDPGIDAVLAWETKPEWTNLLPGVYEATLDIVDDALPSSLSEDFNYFVHLRMANDPAGGRSFIVSLPEDAIVTSETPPSITSINTATLTSSGGGAGEYKKNPHIMNVKYIDYKTLDIEFDMNMNSDTTDCSDVDSCASIYTLKTKYPGDDANEKIVSAVLQGDNKTVRLTAHDSVRISASYSDTITVSTDYQDAPKDLINGMPQTDGMPRSAYIDYSPIKISEVQLATSDHTTDEFIELYNSSNSIVNITGWKIGALINNTYSDLLTIDNVTLEAGKYYLIANSANDYHLAVTGTTVADASYSGKDIGLNDTVILKDADGVVRDMIGIGDNAILYEGNFYPLSLADATAGKGIERKAIPSSTAITMAEGGIDELRGNGYDSDDNNYDFILKSTLGPQNNSLTAEISGGSGENIYIDQAPIIDHMPVINGIAGKELKIPARISDPEDTFTQLTIKKLCYRLADAADWSGEKCVNGQLSFGDNVVFTIPASDVTINGIDYYIHVKDLAGHDVYGCTYPEATTKAQAQTNAYPVNISSITGTRTISGNVYQSNCATPISGAIVKIEGLGMETTSNSNGAFVFNNVSDGVYNLRAMAGGYIDGEIWGVSVNINNPNSSGWQFCLQSGTAGQGGDINKPHVIFTAPNEGMMGAPTDIAEYRAPIIIGFDKEIKPSTITKNNVLLKKMEGGSASIVSDYNVKYNSDRKEIIIYSNTRLEPGYSYIVEITPAVTDNVGNSIDGARIGGGFEFMFTTGSMDMMSFGGGAGFGFIEGDITGMMMDEGYKDMMSHYDAELGKWDGGEYSPPYILGSVPVPGAFNVPTNTKIIFTFSEALDSNSVNTTNFKLYQVVNNIEIDKTSEKVIDISLDNQTKTIITMTTSGLEAGQWMVRVKAGVRGTSGLTIGPPNNPTMDQYTSDFNVGSDTDDTGPSVLGTYPSDGATDVPLDFGFVDIGFDEPLDPLYVNSSTITLKTGTLEVPGTVDYDPIAHSVKFFPSTGLMPGAKYTLTIREVKDLAGNSISAPVIKTFTMSTTMDTEKPRIEFANADDYSLAITFSKPMNAAKITDANRWPKSVLNPANYTIKINSVGPNTGDSYTIPDNASFIYEHAHNTVKIKGLDLGDMGFEIIVTNVTDILGNPIDVGLGLNQTGGPVMSSADTIGFIGPGGAGIMGPPPGAMGVEGAMVTKPTGFGGHMASDIAMMPVEARPMNITAGATTTYFIDFPISKDKAINNGGSIKLTFPKGFDISSAIPDPYNPDKNDLNLEGPGIVTLKTSDVVADSPTATTKGGAANDGITVSGQTVTIHLAVNGNNGRTGTPDFLHFEIKGITNSSIPKDFDTSGYTVDMKSYNADGTLLESKTSMPFFISKAGTNKITVNVYLDSQTNPDDKSCNIDLFIDSPITGPQDATINIKNGSGSKTLENLPDGDYHIFMEPTFTCGGTEYSANTFPEPVWVSGGETKTKNIVVKKLTAGVAAPLDVYLTGDFNGEDVDIFAGGPSAFTVKTEISLGNVTNHKVTLWLPQNGAYMVGIGPAIPKGPMMGPPPMPDWMPPKPINVRVSGIGGTVKIVDEYGNDITESGISFNVGSADKQIVGIVTDGVPTDTYPNGTPISNAEVFAFQPMGFGGKGSHTRSKADGTFVLKVAEYGMYNVGAFIHGMPESPEQVIEVKSGTAADTKVYINGKLSTGSSGSNPFVIKLKKSDYTVSGKIFDYSDNPLQYAPVWAKETTSGRIVHTVTDQNGNYILFVDAGTWQIKAEMPYGTDACGSITKTVTVSVSTGNLSNQNIRPTLSACYELSGTVTLGGVPIANIPVFLEEWDTVNNRPTGGYHRDTITDKNGVYRFKVGNGTYWVGSWTPDYGELTVSGGTVTISGASVTNANITAANLYTLTIPITGGTADMTGFVEIKSTAGLERKGIPIRAGDLTGNPPTISVNLPAGIYNIKIHIDGVGDYSEN